MYRLINKIRFILHYIFYRFFLDFFLLKPKKAYFYSILFFLKQAGFSKWQNNDPKFTKITSNSFSFNIRPKTLDFLVTLPYFEKLDIDHLSSLISNSLEARKRIAFIDVGADIGTYTIILGSRFQSYLGKTFFINSFEPTSSSFEHLKMNVTLNNLDKKKVGINLHHFGLSDKNVHKEISLDLNMQGNNSLENHSTNSSSELVSLKIFDTLHLDFHDCDEIYLKIDIEGHEKNALEGMKETFKKYKVTILIEDFFDPSVTKWLSKNKFYCMHKFTPYNSFWTNIG